MPVKQVDGRVISHAMGQAIVRANGFSEALSLGLVPCNGNRRMGFPPTFARLSMPSERIFAQR